MQNNIEIHRLYHSSGLTKKEFCKRAGIHVNYINHILNNSITLKDETLSKYQKNYEQSIQNPTTDDISQTGNKCSSSNSSI